MSLSVLCWLGTLAIASNSSSLFSTSLEMLMDLISDAQVVKDLLDFVHQERPILDLES